MKPAVMEHVAVWTLVRGRGPDRRPCRLDLAVKCSCGARALLIVVPCEDARCPGVTHVRGGSAEPTKAKVKGCARSCPAVVFAVRSVDLSLTPAQAETVAFHGPKPSGP